MSSQLPHPSRRSRRSRRFLIGGTAALAAAGLATAGVLVDAFGPARQPAAASSGLIAFEDCQAVDDWFTDALLPRVTPWGIDDPGIAFGGRMEDMPMAASGAEDEDRAMADAEAPAPASVGVGSTGTNLQEAGVDEPDLAKTANGLLYTVSGDHLVVLDVTGPAPRELGRLRLADLGLSSPYGDGTVELLLAGDRVVVFSTGSVPAGEPWGEPGPDNAGPDDVAPSRVPLTVAPLPDVLPVEPMPGIPYRPQISTTRTIVVDVSDPASPRQVSAQEIEGRYLSARLTDGRVRVVTASTPQFPFSYDHSPGQDSAAAQQRNREALEAMTGPDFLPRTVVRDGGQARLVPRTDCSAVTHPQAFSGSGVITVRTLDPGLAAAVVDEDLVVADGDLVYASRDRLYVATTRSAWSVLSGNQVTSTQLHGFGTDDDQTRYLASGSVSGRVLGRWAFSEQDGLLRVATTRDGGRTLTGGWRPSDSAVSVFRESGGTLEQIGQVGGLGVDEQIHAVRWMGETAYVVTFRQTDPLYVVDLSDPTAPAVTGELKIPGFSSYLHPVAAGRLLGVGRDATDTGAARQAQVSLFDTTDPADPRRSALWHDAQAAGGWSYSTVAEDSRQFSYLPGHRIALVPLMDGAGGQSVVALRVGDTTLDQTGRWQVPGRSFDIAPTDRFHRPATVRRAIVTGSDRVILLTDDGSGLTLTAADVVSLTPSGSLKV